MLVPELTVCFVCSCRGSHALQTAKHLTGAYVGTSARPLDTDPWPIDDLDYDTDQDANLSPKARRFKIFAGFVRHFQRASGQCETPEVTQLCKDPTQGTGGASSKQCRTLFTASTPTTPVGTKDSTDLGITHYVAITHSLSLYLSVSASICLCLC